MENRVLIHSSFFPVVLQALRQMPVIGTFLSLPYVRGVSTSCKAGPSATETPEHGVGVHALTSGRGQARGCAAKRCLIDGIDQGVDARYGSCCLWLVERGQNVTMEAAVGRGLVRACILRRRGGVIPRRVG